MTIIDRQKLETILSRRFPGSARHQLAAAANAIMGLSEEWEEVLHDERQFGYHDSSECGSVCDLAPDVDDATEFRLFRRPRRRLMSAPQRPPMSRG